MELSLDEDVMEVKEHMKKMLEKYFG